MATKASAEMATKITLAIPPGSKLSYTARIKALSYTARIKAHSYTARIKALFLHCQDQTLLILAASCAYCFRGNRVG
jgi:hypothetical protein